MKKIIITGASGFLGKHIINKLKSHFELIGIVLHKIDNIEGVILKETNSYKETINILKDSFGDVLIHTAFVNKKPKNVPNHIYLNQVIEDNYSLFKWCAKLKIKILLISSSAVYGDNNNFYENTPFNPISIYGLAKSIQESLLNYCLLKYDLEYCIIRPFNIVGPGQKQGMIFPDWVNKVKKLSNGSNPILNVKTLNTCRDFVDVRDVVGAIFLILNNFNQGTIYNLGSGNLVSLINVINELKKISGIDFVVKELNKQKPNSDIDGFAGSYDRIKHDYGWEPLIPWEKSLFDLYNESSLL